MPPCSLINQSWQQTCGDTLRDGGGGEGGSGGVKLSSRAGGVEVGSGVMGEGSIRGCVFCVR